MKGIKFNNLIVDFPEEFALKDLPKFTNKIYIQMGLVTSLAGVFTLPIVSSSNFVVDWGDGTTSEYTDATTSIKHTYTNTSFSGWIYIYGDWNGIKFTSSSNSNKLVIVRVIYDYNITSIPSQALDTCSRIKEIVINNPNTTIGVGAFDNCNAFYYFDLPKNLTTLDSQTFNYCNNLKEIKIPKTVTTINNQCFKYCSGLTKVTIPDAVTNIGTYAFQNTSYLRYVEIGETNSCAIKTINGYAFDNQSIHCLNIKALTPPSIQSTTFSNVKLIRVPYSSLKSYKTATNWAAWADKIYPEGGNYSETITIPSTAWDTTTNTVTVEAVGATSEDRNIITWNVSSGGVQVENTYGLKCTAQGTMSLTFSCETIPTEDVEVSVRYMLTNY